MAGKSTLRYFISDVNRKDLSNFSSDGLFDDKEQCQNWLDTLVHKMHVHKKNECRVFTVMIELID